MPNPNIQPPTPSTGPALRLHPAQAAQRAQPAQAATSEAFADTLSGVHNRPSDHPLDLSRTQAPIKRQPITGEMTEEIFSKFLEDQYACQAPDTFPLSAQALPHFTQWPAKLALFTLDSQAHGAEPTAYDRSALTMGPPGTNRELRILRSAHGEVSVRFEERRYTAPVDVPRNEQFIYALGECLRDNPDLVPAFTEARAQTQWSPADGVQYMIEQALRENPELVANHLGLELSTKNRARIKLLPQIEKEWGPVAHTVIVELLDQNAELQHDSRPMFSAIRPDFALEMSNRVRANSLPLQAAPPQALPHQGLSRQLADFSGSSQQPNQFPSPSGHLLPLPEWLKRYLLDRGNGLTDNQWRVINDQYNDASNRIVFQYGITGQQLIKYAERRSRINRISTVARDAVSAQLASGGVHRLTESQRSALNVISNYLNSRAELHPSGPNAGIVNKIDTFESLANSEALAVLTKEAIGGSGEDIERADTLLDSKFCRINYDNKIPANYFLELLADRSVPASRLALIASYGERPRQQGEIESTKSLDVKWMRGYDDATVKRIMAFEQQLWQLGGDDAKEGLTAEVIEVTLAGCDQQRIHLLLGFPTLLPILASPDPRILWEQCKSANLNADDIVQLISAHQPDLITLLTTPTLNNA